MSTITGWKDPQCFRIWIYLHFQVDKGRQSTLMAQLELVSVSGLAGISLMTVTLYNQNPWKLYKDHSINV